jgi:drug/metabolite transporter (DMT)-like permease
MQKYGTYLVFFAAMLWATDSPFRIHLTQALSSNFIVLGEHTVDMLFALPLLIIGFNEIRKLEWKEWLAVLIIGIGGSALAGVAFTEAFHYVNPSVAILLQKLQPLIAISLAGLMLKEKLTSRFWLWAAVALGGAYLISFPSLVPQSYPGEIWNPNVIGALLALVAAFFWGISTVLGKYVLNKRSFQTMTSLRFAVGFVFLLALNFATGSFPSFSAITDTDYLFIIIIAMVSGVVSLFIYYRGLSYTKASVATLAELGYPMAAVAINWFFIPGSALVPMQIVGAAVLLFAVLRLAHYNDPDTSVNDIPLDAAREPI